MTDGASLLEVAMARRRFLRLAAVAVAGGTGAFIAACNASSQTSAPTTAPTTGTPGAPATPVASKALEKITYMGDFDITGSSGPLLLAQQRGYFAEQGLEVTIQPGTGSGNTAKIVGAGTAQMGRVDGGVVVKSVGAKIPIKAVCGLILTSPMSVIVLTSSTMRKPKDLEGKKLAGAVGGSQEVLFPGWMALNGADASKVEIVSATTTSRETAMLTGAVDGAFGFVYSDVYDYQSKGLDVYPIRYADFGFNLPGLTFVANTTFLAEKPELVRGFVAAAMKGFADSLKDEQAAIDALISSPLGNALDAKSEAGALHLMLPLLTSPATQGHPLGWMPPDSWSKAIDALSAAGVLPDKPALDAVFTDDFVPSA